MNFERIYKPRYKRLTWKHSPLSAHFCSNVYSKTSQNTNRVIANFSSLFNKKQNLECTVAACLLDDSRSSLTKKFLVKTHESHFAVLTKIQLFDICFASDTDRFSFLWTFKHSRSGARWIRGWFESLMTSKRSLTREFESFVFPACCTTKRSLLLESKLEDFGRY